MLSSLQPRAQTPAGGAGHVGSIHQVVERFTGGEPESLSIQFRDPHEVFDPAQRAAARAAARAMRRSAPPTARSSARGWSTSAATRLGMVLRTHFFLGLDLLGTGMDAATMARVFPDAAAPKLLQHCYDEFSNHARLLPALWEAETGTSVRPW